MSRNLKSEQRSLARRCSPARSCRLGRVRRLLAVFLAGALLSWPAAAQQGKPRLYLIGVTPQELEIVERALEEKLERSIPPPPGGVLLLPDKTLELIGKLQRQVTQQDGIARE
jgi:hypothetical protein